MRVFYITILFVLASISQLVAQSSCERNLNEARSDYANGNLYAVPGKLGDCLEEGFSKSEKIQALRLLTLTYININQQDKARSTLIKLLNLKTDYQAVEGVDPSELYSLYRDIDTDIKYFIGITAGFNVNSIVPQFQRNTYPLDGHIANYEVGFSIPQVGLQFLYPITKNIIVGAEIQYQNHQYAYNEVNQYEEEKVTTVDYESSNDGINLNLSIRYQKDFYRWKPFLEIGSIGRYNLNYEIRNYTNSFSETVDEENIEQSNIYDYRAKFNFALNANIGTMIKLGENYGEIKFGVSNYFRNHLNKVARENVYNSSLLNGMLIKEDDYTNIVFQMSFTFNIPFFNFQ
jgi:hypothetical protein